MAKERNYKILAKSFNNWFQPKYESAYKEFNYDTCPKKVLKAKNIDYKEFYLKYIQPFEELDENLLEITLQALCANLKDKTSSKDFFFNISRQYRIGRKLNALQWLSAQVADTQLFPMQIDYKEPYKQCLYCGMPNFYIRENEEKTNREEVYFTEQKKCCHKYDCIVSSTNLNDHEDGCHYKIWKQKKKNLRQNLNRTYDLLEKQPENKKYIHKKLEKIFIEFCEKQLKENLKIDYTIQYWAKMPGYSEQLQFIEAIHYKDLAF